MLLCSVLVIHDVLTLFNAVQREGLFKTLLQVAECCLPPHCAGRISGEEVAAILLRLYAQVWEPGVHDFTCLPRQMPLEEPTEGQGQRLVSTPLALGTSSHRLGTSGLWMQSVDESEPLFEHADGDEGLLLEVFLERASILLLLPYMVV